jgi:hypothetical protein
MPAFLHSFFVGHAPERNAQVANALTVIGVSVSGYTPNV